MLFLLLYWGYEASSSDLGVKAPRLRAFGPGENDTIFDPQLKERGSWDFLLSVLP